MTQENKGPNHVPLQIDYERPGIPVSASILQPVVYKQGDKFHCLLGPDQESGIVGCGETPEKALQEWDHNLTRLLEGPSADEDLKRCIKMQLGHKDMQFTPIASNGEPGELGTETVGSIIMPPERAAIPRLNTDQRKHTTDESNNDGSE